jgi:hypothetical protein
MLILAKFIGIFIFCMGVMIFVKPAVIKKMRK